MELGTILLLGACAYGIYYLKNKTDEVTEEYLDRLEDERQKNEDLQSTVNNLQNIVNPNSTEHQPNLSIAAAMTSGGATLSHNEIDLIIKNESDIDVEIGDFRADLYIAGVKSLKCLPANNGRILIKPGKTVTFRMYARGGEIIQKYNEVKRLLNEMIGRDKTELQKDTFIPATDNPIDLDIAFFWFWTGGKQQVNVFNIPGSFRYRYAGWTVATPWAGYNAAVKNQRKANPSLWDEYEDTVES